MNATAITKAGITWENGLVNVAWSRPDPSCNSVDGVAITDKAVQLKSDSYVAWFPKSAFQVDKYATCFEVRDWFRAKMTRHQKKAIGFAR